MEETGQKRRREERRDKDMGEECEESTYRGGVIGVGERRQEWQERMSSASE